MGGGGSKSVEMVKSENFKQSMLTDESFSIFNFHSLSGFGEAALVFGVLGLCPRPYQGQMARSCKEGGHNTQDSQDTRIGWTGQEGSCEKCKSISNYLSL
jgi:hypothetical protein